MVTGGVANTALTAGAPFGARARAQMQAPATQPPLRAIPRPAIRYGQANASGQASYGSATITKPMIRTGQTPKKGLILPGLSPATPDRGHLIANVLGGAAKSPQEAVALSTKANRGQMNSFENAVKARVLAGEIVEYFVQPLYRAMGGAPSAVILSAQGSRGGFTPRVVQNSGGRRR